jgi:transposase
MMVDPNIVETYSCGKEGFIVALCEALGVPGFINAALSSDSGRPPEVSYGVLAMMMMVNMCHDHRPMYKLDDYYKYTDLEGLFHCPISLDQINDDRFGGFLDLFYEAGCRKIFSQIAAKAVIVYGIQVKNINFDTTAKVMWGNYETDDGTVGAIEINFGHSKDKRPDKNQIKYGIGCANGIVVDAVVLSGNKDDKTYNTDTLKEIDNTLVNLGINRTDFYYIADSALFSVTNLNLATEKNIKLITRIPDNVLIAQEAIHEIVNKLPELDRIIVKNTRGDAGYKIIQNTCKYQGTELKIAACYSETLKTTKERTILKAVEKEAIIIAKLSKSISTRKFACKEDAQIEIDKIISKDMKKIKYYDLSFGIKSEELRKRGRPSNDSPDTALTYKYFLEVQSLSNKAFIEKAILEACCFVICSNDLSISGEGILREYKTQDCVEKKFQQLKSPQFVNSIYLESPERIEAFSYLMLMCMLILSVAEHVVRRGLSKDNEQVIGSGKIKMKKPTQRAIYEMFFDVHIRVICHPNKPWERSYASPLNDSLKKILGYLKIPENTFIKGVS